MKTNMFSASVNFDLWSTLYPSSLYLASISLREDCNSLNLTSVKSWNARRGYFFPAFLFVCRHLLRAVQLVNRTITGFHVVPDLFILGSPMRWMCATSDSEMVIPSSLSLVWSRVRSSWSDSFLFGKGKFRNRRLYFLLRCSFYSTTSSNFVT